MWIFMSDAFLSVVQDENDPDYLIVRARQREHLNNINVPNINIYTVENSDYQYRTRMHKATFGVLVSGRIRAINYPKFKPSAYSNDYHRLLLEVWRVVYEFYYDEYEKIRRQK